MATMTECEECDHNHDVAEDNAAGDDSHEEVTDGGSDEDDDYGNFKCYYLEKELALEIQLGTLKGSHLKQIILLWLSQFDTLEMYYFSLKHQLIITVKNKY